MSAQIEAPSMPHGCRKYLKMHKSVARKTPFFICSLMKPGQRKKSHDHRHVIFSIFLHFQIPQVWSTVWKNLFWLVDRKPRDQKAVAGNIIATELYWNSQLALRQLSFGASPSTVSGLLSLMILINLINKFCIYIPHKSNNIIIIIK